MFYDTSFKHLVQDFSKLLSVRGVKMFVLIVANGVPSPVGSGIFEFEQAKALKLIGCKVVFAVIDLTSIRHRRKMGIESYEKDNIDVIKINVPCGRIGTRNLNMIGYFAFKKLYKRIQDQYGTPDVIHAHFSLHPGVAVMRAIRNQNIPLIITEHLSSIHNKSITSYELSCLNDVIAAASTFICVGEGLKRSIIELTKTNKNIEVIPNIVSPLFICKEKKKTDNEFIFLSVGNLNEGKRFDLSIEAFTEAFKGNKKVKYKIVGDGPLYNLLLRKIDKLDMNEQISLLGKMRREDVVSQMQQCNAFVLASSHETFGVVYVEALACGKPVIGAKNGGADGIIDPTNGMLIDVDDITQLICAMKAIHENIDNYNRIEISNECKNNYGQKTIANRLLGIYERLVERNGN
jgi:glycosyltransferase involved in cell wall biosynthesis